MRAKEIQMSNESSAASAPSYFVSSHIYELGNRGPCDILQADVFILWPIKRPAGNLI